MPTKFDLLDSRRIRIKQLADEIERWPSPVLIEELCHEAECACGVCPRFAFWFFAVRDAGLNLISEGGWRAWQQLPKAIEALDNAVTLDRLIAQAS